MRKFNKLMTDRIILRPFTQNDLEEFYKYRSDKEIARYQLWEPFSRQEAEEFLNEYKSLEYISPGKWNGLALGLKGSSELIGDCAFKILDNEFTQAEIGFNLSPQYQKRGLATEAVKRLVDYLFKELKLHRISAITDARNNAAASLLKRIGMRKEGYFIQNIWVKGKWGDEFLFAILKDEWKD